eukprot:3836390-Alexandrium_andersonii.AAC.1
MSLSAMATRLSTISRSRRVLEQRLTRARRRKRGELLEDVVVDPGALSAQASPGGGPAQEARG